MGQPASSLIRRARESLQEFLQLEAAGGLMLMGTSALAMVLANSPLSSAYNTVLSVPLEVHVGEFAIAKPLLLWVNDGLMAVFFFLVGMELKREVMEGHLSTASQASLPAFAALGGMLVPAGIYVAFNHGDVVAMKGWAIPMATDIAFALGVLSLLGDRVPPALKAFLLSVAIFDDLGAILVIALFYAAELSTGALMFGAIAIAALFVINRAGVTRPAAYLLIGIPLWIAVLKSGVHATLAGVVAALFIPMSGVREGSEISPLRELEHALHPWVAIGVLPIFAFANAGVSLSGLSVDDLLHPVPLGIALGLVVGKVVGFSGAAWLATRVGIASLPEGVRWPELVATTLLGGIGFTMSLFVASLAFEQVGDAYLGLERIGILVGSLVAGIGGYAALRALLGDPRD